MTAIRGMRRRSAELPRQSQSDFEILIVEDQRSVAMALAEMLFNRWGCRALIATSLAQVNAIVAQDRHEFFLAISDLNLPDAHQGEVIDVLRRAGIPTIAMTGYFNQAMHDPIMGKGVIDYVLKDSVNAYEYLVELVGRLYRNTAISVLVLDDDRSFCEVMRHMLHLQRLSVITAATGEEAIAALAEHPEARLALVDYSLPDMDGLNFVAMLRRSLSKNRFAVIGISGVAEPMIATQFLKVGANDFLAKPFSYDELVCRVSHNLQMLENIEEIHYAASHDYLTGLLNRRAFFERSADIYRSAAREQTPVIVAMMDIDFFKKINDGNGHDAGDAVLQHVAELLRKHFGAAVVGRLGGEEFAVVAAGHAVPPEQLEKFRIDVAQSPVEFGKAGIRVTISIGATTARAENVDAALKRADRNLYQAKAAGRDRTVVD